MIEVVCHNVEIGLVVLLEYAEHSPRLPLGQQSRCKAKALFCSFWSLSISCFLFRDMRQPTYSTRGRIAYLYTMVHDSNGRYLHIFKNWKSLYENFLKILLEFGSRLRVSS